MRPKPEGKMAKGRVERFYAPEAKGKNGKKARRGVLCARSQREKWKKGS
ncbi:hypothetical protein QFZ87_000257 [Bacillus sp. SLBN-46]|nr:hypothetical protein [Bacillus sp. SLBN-46]